MNTQKGNTENLALTLNREELVVLHQALNEVLHGLNSPELSTRMGAERKEIAALMKRLKKASEEAAPVAES